MESNVFVRYLFDSFNSLYLLKECRGPNYGYGCNQSCECIHGTCNPNATNSNESCICDPVYQPPFCVQLKDACGKNINFIDELLDSEENLLFFSGSNSPCNNITEDCTINPNNGN